jgi:hypothetical protein
MSASSLPSGKEFRLNSATVLKLGGASGSSDGMPLAYTPRFFQAEIRPWTASSRLDHALLSGGFREHRASTTPIPGTLTNPELLGSAGFVSTCEMVPEKRISRHSMSTIDYFREQAARCRRLAKQMLDRDLERRLLELAEEFDKRAEEIIQRQGRGERSSE